MKTWFAEPTYLGEDGICFYMQMLIGVQLLQK